MGDEDDAGDGRQPSRSSGPRATTGAVVVLLVVLLAVLAAASTGGWQDPYQEGEVTGEPPTLPTASLDPDDQQEVTALPEDLDVTPPDLTWVRWVLLGLGALAATVLLALLVRQLLAVLRPRPPLPLPDDADVSTEPAAEAHAPEIREGIARAQEILDSDLPPGDAVVAAWVELERAAGAAGIARSPAQTATEFTAVVLERTPAERDPVAVLCRLYLRVRFSGETVGTDDGAAARTAIAAIARSWSDVRVER